MTIDEFTDYLKAMPKEVSWHMQDMKFKGDQFTGAQIFFEIEYKSKDEIYEEEDED